MDSVELARLHRELGIPVDYADRRGLLLQQEATEQQLTLVANAGEREIRLTFYAAAAWLNMRQSAERESIVLLPLSGFRSVERQAEIIRAQLGLGRTIDDILHAIAAPGFSEHHTGRAIDLGTLNCKAVDESFRTTAAYQWLTENAAAHGFVMTYPRDQVHGFVFEPWHWCWQPKR